MIFTFGQAKLAAGVKINQYMPSYGNRPNDYNTASKCALLTANSHFSFIDPASVDFRSKFSSIHQSYSPNRERNLYGMYIETYTPPR